MQGDSDLGSGTHCVRKPATNAISHTCIRLVIAIKTYVAGYSKNSMCQVYRLF